MAKIRQYRGIDAPSTHRNTIHIGQELILGIVDCECTDPKIVIKESGVHSQIALPSPHSYASRSVR